MAVMIESLIGVLLFTILIVSLTLKNPLTSVGDYPPVIREKCMELGLIEKREQRFTRADILRKGIALLAFCIRNSRYNRQAMQTCTCLRFWRVFYPPKRLLRDSPQAPKIVLLR